MLITGHWIASKLVVNVLRLKCAKLQAHKERAKIEAYMRMLSDAFRRISGFQNMQPEYNNQ